MRRACRFIGHNVLVAARSLASSRAEWSGWCSCAAAPQTVCAPSEGMHPIGSVQPVWGHSIRERRFHLIESIAPDQNGLNDHRWGVLPHRQQASSWSWSPVLLPRFCRRRLSGVYRCPACPRLRSRAPSATPFGRLSAPVLPARVAGSPSATPDRRPTGPGRAVLYR